MAKRIIPFGLSTTHAADPLDQFLPETPRLPPGSRGRVSLGLVKLILIAQLTAALIQAKLLELRERHVA